MTTLKGLKKFKALTIIRRGDLSKKHLSNPEVGLPDEARKAQEEPVEITLEAVEFLDMKAVREGREGVEDGVK